MQVSTGEYAAWLRFRRRQGPLLLASQGVRNGILGQLALAHPVAGVNARVEVSSEKNARHGLAIDAGMTADDLVAVLDAIDSKFGLARGAEVTTEANPESVDAKYFDRLRSGGFTRVSLGMQSAASSVLATLDRVHTPGRAVDAARTARASGFDEVSLDLIYGAPGETDERCRPASPCLPCVPPRPAHFVTGAEPNLKV